MSLLFRPLLATNYDGIHEYLAWLATLGVAAISALLAVLLSPFPRTHRASHICGYGALLFSCLSTLVLFLSLYPVNRSKDGYREETRETLIVISSCTVAALVARLAAALRASHSQTRSVTPPPADERNA